MREEDLIVGTFITSQKCLRISDKTGDIALEALEEIAGTKRES